MTAFSLSDTAQLPLATRRKRRQSKHMTGLNNFSLLFFVPCWPDSCSRASFSQLTLTTTSETLSLIHLGPQMARPQLQSTNQKRNHTTISWMMATLLFQNYAKMTSKILYGVRGSTQVLIVTLPSRRHLCINTNQYFFFSFLLKKKTKCSFSSSDIY